MKALHLPLLLILAAATLAATPAPAQRAQAERAPITPASIAAGNRRFAIDLYRELAREEPGNLFFSPTSLALAIAPLAAGANGETRDAIGRTLSLPGTEPDLAPAFGALQRSLERNVDGAEISIANALWLNRSYTLRPAFLETARTNYDAVVETLDFGGDPSGAAARINGWADAETRGRIPVVIQPDNLGSATQLVITNAVYFLASWQTPFPAGSEPGPFTLANGQRIELPMMRQTDTFRYYHGGSFAALDLPYRDERLVMTILLPDEPDGLAALERSLRPAVFDRIFRALDRAEPRPVSVALPKLTLRANYPLTGVLGRMGLRPALSPAADFAGISEMPLRISSITQLTYLRVDESGTEAAAVTVGSIVVTGTRYGTPPIPFHADHPFIFMLRDRESGVILFLGRIVHPE